MRVPAGSVNSPPGTTANGTSNVPSRTNELAVGILPCAILLVLLLGLGLVTVRALEIHGHRGARGLLPENTIPAFEHAIELGVDVLELDLGMTRDGIPVAHHDRALDPDRTRDATGAWLTPPGPFLNSLALAELSEFDVGRVRPGSKAAQRFPKQNPRDGTRIPTLAEVLALGRRSDAGTVRFNIETKVTPLAPEETAGPEEFARAVVGGAPRGGDDRQGQSFSRSTGGFSIPKHAGTRPTSPPSASPPSNAGSTTSSAAVPVRRPGPRDSTSRRSQARCRGWWRPRDVPCGLRTTAT